MKEQAGSEAVKYKKISDSDLVWLATTVFPRIEMSHSVGKAIETAAKEYGYAKGSFRRKYYQWQKAVYSNSQNGGFGNLFCNGIRPKWFTEALARPLKESHSICYAISSFESFKHAHESANRGPKCKESKLKQLYALFCFLSNHPIVFHWDSVARHVAGLLPEYKGKRPSAIADDLYRLYKMGALVINPPPFIAPL